MTDSSASIKWHTERNESFHFVGLGWNVTKAKQIIIKHPREIVSIDYNAFEPLLAGPSSTGLYRLGVSIDRKRIISDEIDLSVPVIIVEGEDGKHMLIDGWHRLGKAIQLRQNLLAVILQHEEFMKYQFDE